MKGVQRASDAVAVTLGTSGANSVIEVIESPGHFVSNDGATILSRIRFEDPLEEMGRKILLEAVGRANRASGDGSSTATVLTAAILEEGVKHIGEVAPMEIKRSLDACLPLIEKSLKAQKKDLIDAEGNIDFKLLEQVASISAEDESIGKMIAEIYGKIGKEGIINWEASKTNEDSYSLGSGLKIDGATYVSRYMCDFINGEYTKQATLEAPYVLLAKAKMTGQYEMEKLIAELQDKGVKELAIFCDEMDAPMINSFVLARAPQTLGMRFVVIKMPTVFNDDWWEDLEKATGGRIISASTGIRMKDAKMEFLGVVGKIVVTPEDTFIDGVASMKDHIRSLEAEGTELSLARAARLNTKTAKYCVGGISESGLAYRRLKVEDAINSAWCAMQHGIVAGGGAALQHSANALDIYNKENIGAVILNEALRTPQKQIIKNSSGDYKELMPKMGGNLSFNSKTGKVVDMFEAGIVDSYDVVLGAVKNAIGVASGILTCGTVVLLPRQEESIEGIIRNIVQTP